MWRCPRCCESVEDSFELCWNCGAARDGTVDADFQREPADADEDSAIQPHQTGPDSVSAKASGGSMTRQEIGVLICKTLALLLFAQSAFFSISGLVLMLSLLAAAPALGGFNWDEFYLALVLSVPMLATVIVGLVYWIHSDSIAARMVPPDPAPVTTLPISVQDLMMVAFSTAGLFILVEGVRDFISMVYLTHSYDLTTAEYWYHPRTTTALIQLALALWLILGSRGIVGAIQWLRRAGREDGGNAHNAERSE